MDEENINRESNVDWNDSLSRKHNYESLRDKWNDIQEEYLKEHPNVELGDLYFETGGFERVLEKISEVTNKTVPEIRSEIENW
ncbi:hypothetical protein Q4603_20090 [Zobellia galactanivorans]|uniref:hypothetical protein n=1 Tax=Zobellia galactanivorans (strain DSM 12802 / CCUG 47099 / CIP 106680 / NCIMB 13871 / Dsij) TaxID=63186 RepID=UPI001C06C334|nr:hypothetical protein [Zobellia galactanivorans]MBU3025206.1 hypothetical protein [Zobellia galactanivorans]MDO6810933.1 hypothetical protein [Zobellia galactanivorans]